MYNPNLEIEIHDYALSSHSRASISVFGYKILWTCLLSSMLLIAKIPSNTQQLLVVTTANWSANHGRLQRYEKQHNRWQKVGKPIAVKVGKNGLAWGRGLHRIPQRATRLKREGDGRAPAGIFRLPYAFGDQPIRLRYAYHTMTRQHHCVDDGHSKYYNQVIESQKIRKDYKSFEHMKFPSGLYSYGLFVDHNPKRIAGAGSCIFVHIKKPNGKPTVGCTAMGKSEIVTLLKWLDSKKKPLLVQAPAGVMKRLF
jgi:D-alanyl-D-alanine dipeptidase